MFLSLSLSSVLAFANTNRIMSTMIMFPIWWWRCFALVCLANLRFGFFCCSFASPSLSLRFFSVCDVVLLHLRKRNLVI